MPVRETFAAEAEGPTAPSVNEMRLGVIRDARQALAGRPGSSPA